MAAEFQNLAADPGLAAKAEQFRGQADVADPVEVTRQGAGHLVATGETKHGSTRLVEHIRIDAEPYGAQTRIVGTIIIGVIATDGHRGIEGAILIVQVQRMQDAILPILVGVENVPVNRGQRSEMVRGGAESLFAGLPASAPVVVSNWAETVTWKRNSFSGSFCRLTFDSSFQPRRWHRPEAERACW